MRVVRPTILGSLCLLVALAAFPAVRAQGKPAPLYRQFLNNPSPIEVVAAKKVDRIAWTVYEEGKRNAYTAAAPAQNLSRAVWPYVRVWFVR